MSSGLLQRRGGAYFSLSPSEQKRPECISRIASSPSTWTTEFSDNSLDNRRSLSKLVADSNLVEHGGYSDEPAVIASLNTRDLYFLTLFCESPLASSTIVVEGPDYKSGEGDKVNSDIPPKEISELDLKILDRIADSTIPSAERARLVCRAEMIRFGEAERDLLLETLWSYIQDHRDSNNRDELVAAGAAIRKYIANMPMDMMGSLTDLLEPGHRAPLPPSLELEIAKMIYRNFEVFPPAQPDPHPELSNRLWEMTQDYMNPRFFVRDDYGTVASLAIVAIIAMRSRHAREAWRAAMECPHVWLAMMVADDIDELFQEWDSRNRESAEWLDRLRENLPL